MVNFQSNSTVENKIQGREKVGSRSSKPTERSSLRESGVFSKVICKTFYLNFYVESWKILDEIAKRRGHK